MLRGLALSSRSVALAAGCGDGDKSSGTQATTAGETTTTAPDGATTTARRPRPRPRRRALAYQAWFTRDGQLQLTWVEGEQTRRRPHPGDAAPPRRAVLGGRRDVDPGRHGAHQHRPRRTESRRSTSRASSADADRLAIAQVVYTATQYPTVRAVKLARRGPRSDAPDRAQAQDLRRPAAADRRRDADRAPAGRIHASRWPARRTSSRPT